MQALKKLAIVSGLSTLAAQAYAVGPDLTPISAAFSSDTIVTGILAVAAIVAVVYTAWRGSRIVLSMIKG